MHPTKNVAVWFEIPATDPARAKVFYETVLSIRMKTDMCPDTGDFHVFDIDGADVKGAIIRADSCQPGAATLVYLNGGDDLSGPLSRVEAAGGKVLLPKMELPENWGFIAQFQDSEGNRVGLHSLA